VSLWKAKLNSSGVSVQSSARQSPMVCGIVSVQFAFTEKDINNNDNGFDNNDENVYHVVTGANNAVIDGFMITGGNANGSYPNDCGGGIENDGSSPIITNCTISGNNATSNGGGISNDSSCSPTITNSTIWGNTSASRGGGIYNYNDSSPTITNSTIWGNDAGYGGGMYNKYSSPTITNCTISENNATSNGGGMCNIDSSDPTITNCVFWDDTASSGPEIYTDLSSSPSVTYCDIDQTGYAGIDNNMDH